MTIFDNLTDDELRTLDTETLELLNKQSVQERQAFDWQAAIAMCGQYSIECADGFSFAEYVEEEWNETNDLFDIYS